MSTENNVQDQDLNLLGVLKVAQAQGLVEGENIDMPSIPEPEPTEEVSGLIIDNTRLENTENDPNAGNVFTGISGMTQDAISNYLADYDQDIEDVKAEVEEMKNVLDLGQLDLEPEVEYTEEELTERYNEALIIIDKSKMGTVKFTEEEMAKLEKVEKITLQEIETVSLESIKVRKKSTKTDKDLTKIVQHRSNNRTTPIVLAASGYTAEMGGLSAHEMVNLFRPSQNPLIGMQTKWTIIFEKIEHSSVKFKNFDDFLKQTAVIDMNTFIYGMMCSTYPKDDTMGLKCNNPDCQKDFKHKYSVKSLIRAEQIEPKLQELIATTVDSSYDELSAARTHASAPVSQIKRVRYPDSGIIAEIHLQSAHDLIYKTIKGANKTRESKYQDATIIATVINAMYIPIDDGSDEYDVYTEHDDIVKILYGMSMIDTAVSRTIGEEFIRDMSLQFGLMSITCPHCGNFTQTVPLDIEDILFYKYQQEMEKTLI